MRITTTTILLGDGYGLCLFSGTLASPTNIVVFPFSGLHISGGLKGNGDAYINLKTGVLERDILLKDLENQGWTDDMNGVVDAMTEIVAWINGTETNPT